MEFLDGNIVRVDPPGNPKKITGTRFASVLGLNPYKSPFASWVDMVFSYPSMTHKETKQRLAGRIIEPKIGDFLKRQYGLRIRSPSEAIGIEIPDRWSVDLFPQNAVFGGMYDFIGNNYIVEVKTTQKRTEWFDGPIFRPPIQYSLQGALYAWLCGFDRYIISCTFLNSDNYPYMIDGQFITEPAERFKPSAANTYVYRYRIPEVFPDFENQYIRPAADFWNRYVLTGQSYPYDAVRDRNLIEMIKNDKVYH